MEHITINVKNLNASVAFYTNVLGMKIGSDLRERIGRPIVFLTGENTSTNLELIENPNQSYSGTGLSLGFRVENVESAHAEMTANGLAPSAFVTPTPNTRFFYISDPDGVKIQIL